ncbi:putative arabinogalactan protein/22/41 [Dioscorea sansibarensis]
MAGVDRVLLRLMAFVALIIGIVSPGVRAQAPAPAPTSDGTTIDQAVAYALMILALALTYLIH